MNQNINRFFAIAMAGTIIFTGSSLTGLTAQAKESEQGTDRCRCGSIVYRSN